MHRGIGRTVLVLVVSLLLLLVVACGGGDDDESSGGDDADAAATATQAVENGNDSDAAIDACALLNGAEIETATGVPFGEGVFNEDLSAADRLICDWMSSGDEFATVQVLIVTTGSAFEPNRSSAEEVMGLSDEDVDIPGADESYATEEGSLIGMRIGDLFVQVAYLPSGPGNVLEATQDLANIVASRI